MNNEWGTPSWLFNWWNELYLFDVDAAANEENHKCSKWFGPGGVAEDALDPMLRWSDYGSRFWLNPPYGRGYLDKFLTKVDNELTDGIKVVMLLPVDTSTKWWHKHIDHLVGEPGRIHFLTKRVKFDGANNGARFPSVIVVKGKLW